MDELDASRRNCGFLFYRKQENYTGMKYLWLVMLCKKGHFANVRRRMGEVSQTPRAVHSSQKITLKLVGLSVK